MTEILNLAITVLWLGIVGRVLLSWFPGVNRSNPIVRIIYQISEPILGPLRRVVPRVGTLDLTPMVAIILLFIIANLLNAVT